MMSLKELEELKSLMESFHSILIKRYEEQSDIPQWLSLVYSSCSLAVRFNLRALKPASGPEFRKKSPDYCELFNMSIQAVINNVNNCINDPHIFHLDPKYPELKHIMEQMREIAESCQKTEKTSSPASSSASTSINSSPPRFKLT